MGCGLLETRVFLALLRLVLFPIRGLFLLGHSLRVVNGAGQSEAQSSCPPLSAGARDVVAMDPSAERLALSHFNNTFNISHLSMPHSTCDVVMNDLNNSISSLGKKKVEGKPKIFRKTKKGRPYSMKLDEETGNENRYEDDRITTLLQEGASAAYIDKLYCVDGLSTSDVEWHCGFSREPNALLKL